jgi:predicted DNA-binding transcriptional regulator AlpA
MAAEDVPQEAIASLISQLAALQSVLAARLLTGEQRQDAQPRGADCLLDVEEAAERLGTSADWLYRNARRLPFTVRVGSRQLRFSVEGINRWIANRQGR